MTTPRTEADLERPSGRRRRISTMALCTPLLVLAVLLMVAGATGAGVLVAVGACLLIMTMTMALMMATTGRGHRR